MKNPILGMENLYPEALFNGILIFQKILNWNFKFWILDFYAIFFGWPQRMEWMSHPTRMFDTVLEHQKVILLVFESHRNTPVTLGNTLSTYVDLSVDQNVQKFVY